MRKLILIADDLYVRSFLETGALAEVDGPETNYAASAAMQRIEAVSEKPGFSGTVPLSLRRHRAFHRYRLIAMAALRERSETMRIKTNFDLKLLSRLAVKIAASPRLRAFSQRYFLRKAGRSAEMEEIISRNEPGLVIAPTAGTDTPVWDAIVEARRAGARSLVLINGWDNLSSKAVFPELPDYMGVWGPQAVEQAVSIHGMPRERIFTLGVPTFEQHFSYDPERHPSPYEWPYVLFAGCALPFNELGALRRLESAIHECGRSDLRIVYRPHPWRQPRRCTDAFDPADFDRVVLDRQLEGGYALSLEQGQVGPDVLLPDLSYYPALLGNAEFVVCPLSTMILEALIVRKRVLALTYDDGIHDLPPSVVARFTHFEDLGDTEGVHLCPDESAIPEHIRDVLSAADPPSREGIRKWLHFEDDPYATRLGRVVKAIAGESSEADRTLIPG